MTQRNHDLAPVTVAPAPQVPLEIEEVVDHWGSPGNQQRLLVRWKGTDASMGSWLLKARIPSEAPVGGTCVL